ncbi:MAG: AarF/UbiB family protein [Gemmatimonadota bacterium]|jgi:predicted unusual protein kinase regulating ubiquinone biosynthesis (AarF/ABC1/UbiB family)
MRRSLRTVSVLIRLTPFVVAFLRDRRRFVLIGQPPDRSEKHHERRARRLTAVLGRLGPTFIKLAQLFSARADILPEPYLTHIGTLQDQVPPDPWEKVAEVLEAELGRPVEETFDEFDKEPLAAASLGQVYHARFKGDEVAVKVLRPGVEDVVALDLEISFRVLFWLNVLFRNHHVRALTNLVREFSVRVKEEMDFRHEAKNMEVFRTFFPDEGRVRIPQVWDELTRKRVLVMEYCSGTKIDRLQDRFGSGELDFTELMETLTGLYLRTMMVDGFLHADPHPGNLLVQGDGRIVLLDWGMMLRVPKWTREAILNLALAVERENLDGTINGMYQLGMISPEVSRGEIHEAAVEIMRIVERARGSSRERIQEIVEEIFDTFYTFPLLLPQELVYFFRTSVLLEGIGYRYDPRFDGLGLVRRVIGEFRSDIQRSTGREPANLARDLLAEAQTTISSLRDLLLRAQREELRVRVHPRDIQGQERILHLQARRLLLSIFATGTAVITAVMFIALENYWLLAVGFMASLFMFLLVFLIPTHLLENPLRHARGIRPDDRYY